MDEITKQQSFEERMKTRIKESIGELITDEELSKLVHRSVEEVFFATRQKKVSSWETKEILPFLHEIIKDLLSDSVRSGVEAYINNHPEEVKKTIQQVIQSGMGTALMSALTQKFQTELIYFQQNIEHSIGT